MANLITSDLTLNQVLDSTYGEPRVATPWSDLVDRKEVSLRETQALPLPRICWELYATVQEAVVSNEWVPVRFHERQNRLSLYQAAFDGHITALIPDHTYARVFINEFRQACLFKADMLTSTEIMTSPETIHPAMLANAISACVTSQEQNGIGLLNAGTDEDGEPFIRTIDPICWFPREDGGHIIAVPYVSNEATTAIPDRIRLDILEPDGRAARFVFEYTSFYTKGEMISREMLPGTQYVVPVYRSPQQPGWGTSLFDDLAPIVLEHTIRMTSYSKILNAHENPMLNIFVDPEDAPDFGGSTPTEEAEYEDGDTGAVYRKAQQAADDWRRANVRFGGAIDSQEKLSYLTWDGALDASNHYLDRLEDAMAMISGVPKTLRDSTMAMSGVALRRIFMPLYTSTLAILTDTKYALETVLSMASGTQVTVEWPHPFDYYELQDGQDEEPDGDDADEDQGDEGGSGVEG